MSARKPKQAEEKSVPNKLRLSKETLKDLTDPKGSVKGGWTNTWCLTCSC
jgi:hypothetical protein